MSVGGLRRMMCPSYPATRRDSTCEHTSVREEPDHLYVEATRDELALSRTNRYFRLAVHQPQAARDGVSSILSGRALPRLAKPAAFTTGQTARTVTLSAPSEAYNRPGTRAGRCRRRLPARMRLRGTN